MAKVKKGSTTHDIHLSDTSVIRVSVSNYKGKERLDIRKMYVKDDGGLGYTKKGVSIGVDNIKEVAEAFQIVAQAMMDIK